MKHFVTSLILAMAFTFPVRGGSVGGIGGGGGAVQVSNSVMMTLQNRIPQGDLIKVKELGRDPVYLRPNIESISKHSLRANAIPSGDETVFYSEPHAAEVQARLSLNLARSLKASTGVLPILAGDFTPEPETTVEAVPASEFRDGPLDGVRDTIIE